MTKANMEIQNNTIYKRDMVWSIASALLIVLFILTTNPQNLSVLFLLLFPILVAIASYRFVKLGLELFTSWEDFRVKLYGLVSSVGVTLIVILSSLHQLSLQDFVLSILLVAGFGWYMKRLRSIGSPSV
jgi:hypothetical protein